MKIRKGLAIAAIMATFAFVLAACGSADEGSITVLLPDSASSARWETDDRRYFSEAFDAAGVEYNIVNAEGDPVTQQTQAEQAITAGAKVILLVNLTRPRAQRSSRRPVTPVSPSSTTTGSRSRVPAPTSTSASTTSRSAGRWARSSPR